MISLQKYCEEIDRKGLGITEKALCILWYLDHQDKDVVVKSGRIAKVIFESGIGNPHSTRLRKAIQDSGHVISKIAGFRLKGKSRTDIYSWVSDIVDAGPPPIDQVHGLLSEAVWIGTRGYIEKVCRQMNGCFEYQFWDAASVLMRRLIETLIIEAYEKLKRQNEIKASDGNYLMLKGLITTAINDVSGLGLGRDAKKTLEDVKTLGDRSAHNRRYNAVKADLTRIQSGLRVVADELLHIAGLRD